MGLTDLSSRLIDGVTVHALSRQGTSFVKRRRAGMGAVIAAGNLFLRLSRSGIRMFPSAAAWQRHELECFRALHGDRAEAVRVDDRAIRLGQLPGRSFRELAAGGGITPAMVEAAAREFSRAHAVALASGPFSHGDPHLGNLLFDKLSGDAFLIDFETVHEPGLSDTERRASDLLVFSLALLSQPNFDALCGAFLSAYPDGTVRRAAVERLRYPETFFARVLWAGRTGYLGAAESGRRLGLLTRSLGD